LALFSYAGLTLTIYTRQHCTVAFGYVCSCVYFGSIRVWCSGTLEACMALDGHCMERRAHIFFTLHSAGTRRELTLFVPTLMTLKHAFRQTFFGVMLPARMTLKPRSARRSLKKVVIGKLIRQLAPQIPRNPSVQPLTLHTATPQHTSNLQSCQKDASAWPTLVQTPSNSCSMSKPCQLALFTLARSTCSPANLTHRRS
jgi:hypothetical protein